jgi:hypothetical protein
MNLVFANKHQGVADLVGIVDCIGHFFHQRVLLFLRKPWWGINENNWHNLNLRFEALLWNPSGSCSPTEDS